MQQSLWHHLEIRQSKQCGQLRGVFKNAPEAHFRITKLALDHSKRILNLRTHLNFPVFDFATHTTDQTFSAVLFITVGPCSTQLDHRAAWMHRTFFNGGVTCVARDVNFLAMQQVIDLVYICQMAAVSTTLCIKPDSV